MLYTWGLKSCCVAVLHRTMPSSWKLFFVRLFAARVNNEVDDQRRHTTYTPMTETNKKVMRYPCHCWISIYSHCLELNETIIVAIIIIMAHKMRTAKKNIEKLEYSERTMEKMFYKNANIIDGNHFLHYKSNWFLSILIFGINFDRRSLWWNSDLVVVSQQGFLSYKKQFWRLSNEIRIETRFIQSKNITMTRSCFAISISIQSFDR